MPQSFSSLVVHVVFSTKDRAPLLVQSVRKPLHAYMAGTARNLGCPCYRTGGVDDHVHLAIALSRTITIAKLVEKLKTSSSKWLKGQSPELREFAWQRGYGAFSVSPNHLEPLCRYIDNQEDHHKTLSFEDEYRDLLNKYGLNYDDRYMWD